jgi:hypothetical protein
VNRPKPRDIHDSGAERLASATTREAALIDARERQGVAPVQADRRGTLAVTNGGVGLVFAERDFLN